MFDGIFEDSFAGPGGAGGFASPHTPTAANQIGQGARSRNEPQLPVTCKMVAKLFDECNSNFSIGSTEFAQVSLIGRVRDIKPDSLKVEYQLSDEGDDTNIINVRQWTEEVESPVADLVITEGMFIRAYGHVRNSQDEKFIVAFKILPIEDEKEKQFHELEVRFAHLYYDKEVALKIRNEMMHPGSVTDLIDTPFQPRTEAPTGPAAAPPVPIQPAFPINNGQPFINNGDPNDGIKNQITSVLNTCTDEAGFTAKQLMEKLGYRYTELKISEVLNSMADEGNAFSTIDDIHFKSTTN